MSLLSSSWQSVTRRREKEEDQEGEEDELRRRWKRESRLVCARLASPIHPDLLARILALLPICDRVSCRRVCFLWNHVVLQLLSEMAGVVLGSPKQGLEADCGHVVRQTDWIPRSFLKSRWNRPPEYIVRQLLDFLQRFCVNLRTVVVGPPCHRLLPEVLRSLGGRIRCLRYRCSIPFEESRLGVLRQLVHLETTGGILQGLPHVNLMHVCPRLQRVTCCRLNALSRSACLAAGVLVLELRGSKDHRKQCTYCAM